jgi:hypothetical protein
MQTFNLNSSVTIKLFPTGKAIWLNYWSQFGENTKSYALKELGNDNTLTLQLWEVMKIFGPHISIGIDAPFETEITLHN